MNEKFDGLLRSQFRQAPLVDVHIVFYEPISQEQHTEFNAIIESSRSSYKEGDTICNAIINESMCDKLSELGFVKALGWNQPVFLIEPVNLR